MHSEPYDFSRSSGQSLPLYTVSDHSVQLANRRYELYFSTYWWAWRALKAHWTTVSSHSLGAYTAFSTRLSNRASLSSASLLPWHTGVSCLENKQNTNTPINKQVRFYTVSIFLKDISTARLERNMKRNSNSTLTWPSLGCLLSNWISSVVVTVDRSKTHRC